MAAALNPCPPRAPRPASATRLAPARTARPLRLHFQQWAARLSVAPHDASLAAVADGLRGLYHDAFLGPAAPATGLPELGAVFVGGVCSMARWLDPRRTTQVVPPLCVVLWHVGSSWSCPASTTLWIDFALPEDGRREAAIAWAHDVRLLLMAAQVPHRAEMVSLRGTDPARPGRPGSDWDGAPWGCQSLFEAYRRAQDPLRGVKR